MNKGIYDILAALGYWGQEEPPVEGVTPGPAPNFAPPESSFAVGPWNLGDVVRGASYLPARLLGAPADLTSAAIAPFDPELAGQFGSQAFVNEGVDLGLLQPPTGSMSEGAGELLAALAVPTTVAKSLPEAGLQLSMGLNPGDSLASPAGGATGAPAIIQRSGIQKPERQEALDALLPAENMLDATGHPSAALAFTLGQEGPTAGFPASIVKARQDMVFPVDPNAEERIANALIGNSAFWAYPGHKAGQPWGKSNFSSSNTGIVYNDKNLKPVIVAPPNMDTGYIMNQLAKAQDRFDMLVPDLIDRAEFTPEGHITFAKEKLRPGASFEQMDRVLRALGGDYRQGAVNIGAGAYYPEDHTIGLNQRIYPGLQDMLLQFSQSPSPELLAKIEDALQADIKAKRTYTHELGHLLDGTNDRTMNFLATTVPPDLRKAGENFVAETRPDQRGSDWIRRPAEHFAELFRDRLIGRGISENHPEYLKFGRTYATKAPRSRWDAALFGVPAAVTAGAAVLGGEPGEAQAQQSPGISQNLRRLLDQYGIDWRIGGLDAE